jgi:putative ABC transport system permease protein
VELMTALAWKNLQRRRLRSALTAMSLAAATAVLFSLLAFNRGYQQALQGELDRMGAHLLVVPVGCPYEAASLILKGGQVPNTLPAAALAEIRSQAEVDVAAPLFMAAIPRPEEGRTDVWCGIDGEMQRLKRYWRLTPGSHLPSAAGEVLMGAEAAATEQRAPGDLFFSEKTEREFRVSGVLERTGAGDDGFFFIPLAAAQRMFGKPGQLTAVAVRLKDPTRIAAVARRLGRLQGAEVVTVSELMGTMLNLVGAARFLLLCIVAVAVTIAALGVLNTMSAAVLERTAEIGVLRALGASRAEVFHAVWTEGTLLALLGGALGIGGALVAGRVIEAAVRQVMPLAPEASVLAPDAGLAAGCLLFVAAVGAVAGIYPALRAASLCPTAAIRAE